jgi:hypothetical protein
MHYVSTRCPHLCAAATQGHEVGDQGLPVEGASRAVAVPFEIQVLFHPEEASVLLHVPCVHVVQVSRARGQLLREEACAMEEQVQAQMDQQIQPRGHHVLDRDRCCILQT